MSLSPQPDSDRQPGLCCRLYVIFSTQRKMHSENGKRVHPCRSQAKGCLLQGRVLSRAPSLLGVALLSALPPPLGLVPQGSASASSRCYVSDGASRMASVTALCAIEAFCR